MSKPSSVDAAQRLVILKYIVVTALSTPPPEFFSTINQHWSQKDKKKFRNEWKQRSKEVEKYLKSINLWKIMTKEELTFLNSIPPKINLQYLINATWRQESAVVIMWALQLIDHLPPYDTQSDNELLKLIPSENVQDFINNLTLRSDEEIEKQRDFAELWHWRSRTRQLKERGESPHPDLGFSSFDEIVQKTTEFYTDSGELSHSIDNDFPAKGKAYRDLTDEEWSEVRSITMERHHALNWLCGYAPKNQWDKTPTDT